MKPQLLRRKKTKGSCVHRSTSPASSSYFSETTPDSGTPRTCLRTSCVTKPPQNHLAHSSTSYSVSSTPQKISALSDYPEPWRNSPTSTARSSPTRWIRSTSTTKCDKPCSTPATSTGQKSMCLSLVHCSSWSSPRKPVVAMVSTTLRRPTS
ncbi:hypothetical protein FRC0514_02191 [Corynebacterium diphtheriae]|nr:hypothetical protein FRC0469_02000 [Corynebacterium diphtheriae]CAB1012149.1 hypothetical protein FRC0514_02191 [Corynebacterium diphtheriae]